VTQRGYDDLAPAGDAPLVDDAPQGWQLGSALGTARGIPSWAAVLVALTFTGLGVFVDLERAGRLGLVFKGCYFLGCVLAVLWVQRRALFGPMVQPPLILAVAVPGVVFLGSGAGTGDGLSGKALAVGTPLVNGFPTMAITTGITVLAGLLRVARQRAPRQPRVQTRTPTPPSRAPRRAATSPRGGGQPSPAPGPPPVSPPRTARQGAGPARQPGRPQPRQGGATPRQQQPDGWQPGTGRPTRAGRPAGGAGRANPAGQAGGQPGGTPRRNPGRRGPAG
jgi:hypothetical protein